ncbi:hypothetical protein [Nocardiopsis coralliicola]
MEHPRTARTAALAGGAAALLALLAGCGGGGAGDGGDGAAAPAEAEELAEAQIVQYEDAKVVPEAGQTGVYAELAGVAQTEELREKTELDKPDCADTADGWSASEAVHDAPASVAVFARGDDTISHTLMAVPEEEAEKAVAAAVPDEACTSYTATMEDGTESSYKVAPLKAEQVADSSNAFRVRTETDGEPVWMYSIVYRHGDHLGATTLVGPDAEEDYADLLQGFTESAVEQEEKVLA